MFIRHTTHDLVQKRSHIIFFSGIENRFGIFSEKPALGKKAIGASNGPRLRQALEFKQSCGSTYLA